MNLQDFIQECKQHNIDCPGTMVDVFLDKAVGTSIFIVLTPSDSLEPELYWMGEEALEEELKTFKPGKFFADSVRWLCEKMYKSDTKKLT